ncbi:hypothetical protein IGI04_019542 [Brassica rapa subsp. trilocularis]|uniref:Uncharacterized protein n=1 Tax=Brassica rapa subsp. trilocularis TaxID=1813537 RepID=A0ABQ7MG50_BRACM|nr:hypothetical protein IGI04_019542 [Brassica rapa subsp. trilocularis]
MSTHLKISPHNYVKSKCHVSYMNNLKHGREFIVSDLRMCINALPGHFTKKKMMKAYLKHGNGEAHYIEGV